MLRFSFLIFLSFFLLGNSIEHHFYMNVKERTKIRNEDKNYREKEIFNSSSQVEQRFSSREVKKDFDRLEEAEKCLKCLLKKRNVLEGDFYGINLTAYRYVNIFDRLGYIRYKIMQIDKKIKKTKLNISELKKKF